MYRKPAVLILLFLTLGTQTVAAGPASDNYELKNYGFGGGGTFDSTSGHYKLYGVAGDLSGDPETGTTFGVQPGLVFTLQAAVPPAASLTNPGSAYDRLRLIIDPTGNQSDATYAVAITDDDWATTRYVQNDFTVGDSLGAEDWLTYTDWNETSGRYITGLTEDTSYKVKVKARDAGYSETDWGPESAAATDVPSLTFGVSADTVTFDTLTSGNSWTDDTKNTVLTTSTNAYNGYTVFAHETDQLRDGYGNPIADFASPNSNPSLWTGTGFGYTTDDSNLIGGTPDRFTNGGPKYAGFATGAPGDPVADHSGPIVETPISNEQFTVSYRVTVDETAKAGSYTNTVMYIVVPEY